MTKYLAPKSLGLPPKTTYEHPTKAGHTALAYVVED
jgi:hypothetical protein